MGLGFVVPTLTLTLEITSNNHNNVGEDVQVVGQGEPAADRSQPRGNHLGSRAPDPRGDGDAKESNRYAK